MDFQSTPVGFGVGPSASNADELLEIADRDAGEALRCVVRLCKRRRRADAALMSSGVEGNGDCLDDILESARAVANRVGCKQPPAPNGEGYYFNICEIERWAASESEEASKMGRRVEWNPRHFLQFHHDAVVALGGVLSFGFIEPAIEELTNAEIELEVHHTAARLAQRFLVELALDPVPVAVFDAYKNMRVLEAWFRSALECANDFEGPLGRHAVTRDGACINSSSRLTPAAPTAGRVEVQVSMDGWGRAVLNGETVIKLSKDLLTESEWLQLAGFAEIGGRQDLNRTRNPESERRQLQRIGSKLASFLNLDCQPIAKQGLILESRFASITVLPTEGEFPGEQ